MIQKREKLCDIKCDDTSVALLELPCSNEIHEVDTSINSGPLSNASELIGIQEAISCHLKLKLIVDDFLNEFACSIK